MQNIYAGNQSIRLFAFGSSYIVFPQDADARLSPAGCCTAKQSAHAPRGVETKRNEETRRKRKTRNETEEKGANTKKERKDERKKKE